MKKTMFVFMGKRMGNLVKARELQARHEQKTGEYVSVEAETPWGNAVVLSGEEWKWDARAYAHQIPAQYR